MQQCSEHMEYQLPNEHTRVRYLLEGIQCPDPGLQAAMASIRKYVGPDTMRNNLRPQQPIFCHMILFPRSEWQLGSTQLHRLWPLQLRMWRSSPAQQPERVLDRLVSTYDITPLQSTMNLWLNKRRIFMNGDPTTQVPRLASARNIMARVVATTRKVSLQPSPGK